MSGEVEIPPLGTTPVRVGNFIGSIEGALVLLILFRRRE